METVLIVTSERNGDPDLVALLRMVFPECNVVTVRVPDPKRPEPPHSKSKSDTDRK